MKNKLKLTAIFSAIFLSVFISCTSIISYSASQIKVMVNGNIINSDAVLINDRTYVPLRGVFENVGANVDWDENSNTAMINFSSSSNDAILPNLISQVSPSVVGIIGNYKPENAAEYQDEYNNGIALGSGLIIKSGGEILTNAHVVKDMERIIVVLADGSGHEAWLKAIDEDCDLAVIKIDKLGLPALKFASMDDVVIGKTAVAIGTPVSFSLRNSATCGIISGINRALNGGYRLIQTDTSINPGNSGGPLINLNGEVIGINSSKFVSVGIEGVGFSIPVDTVQYVLKQFDLYGKVRRPSLKATFEDDWIASLGLPSNNGLTIKSIEENSPLKTAGIQPGSNIVSVSGYQVNCLVDLNECFKNFIPGDTVVLKIKNGGDEKDISVVLSEKN